MSINTKQTFIELVSRYHKTPDNFVFFVGAGLSQPLFPSWATLLHKFVSSAKEMGLSHDINELLQYIEKGENYLEIAEACINTMGNTRYRDIMEEVFDVDFSPTDIPESYKALMALSPKVVITTNYDRIPDVAGQGLYRVGTNKNAAETARTIANGKNIVFKMHGDITDQSSIVLKTSDYQNIIHKNPSTTSLLKSLLSTKTLIFIGFSFSDPHLDLILDNIKSINNDMPISHYVLLNENSSFKITAFENKYGVKIISYTPSGNSHPEVAEFLQALNHEAEVISEKIEVPKKMAIKNENDLILHIESALSHIIVDVAFSVFFDKNDLYLSFSPTGETNSEMQKEILSIIRLMNFDCDIVNKIKLTVFAKTPPMKNIDNCQPTLIKIEMNFSDAKSYAETLISTSSLWKLIDCYTPTSLSNPFQSEEKVSFPLSTGIVEV